MSLRSLQAGITERANIKLTSAIAMLLEANEYAEDTGSDRWDFAVSIEQLREFKINESDLRWLVKKGVVDHSREVTVEGDNGRQFRSTGNLSFCGRSCFVLTDKGITTARSQLSAICIDDPISAKDGSLTKPHWIAENRELTIDGRLVKRFKWQAVNQETVLTAFQEDGWPCVIDDPLPPKPEQDSKRRLHDTIKALNRNQRDIRFHGNGTGEGIRWELIIINSF